MTTTSSGADVDPVLPPVVAGDRRPQLADAGGRRCSRAGPEPPAAGSPRPAPARGARAGLAGDEVDQVAVGALPLGRGGEQVHDVERRHVGALGDGQARSHAVQSRCPGGRAAAPPAGRSRSLAELGAGGSSRRRPGRCWRRRRRRRTGRRSTEPSSREHSPSTSHAHAAEGEPGVERRAEGQVEDAPGPGVLRRQPVGVLVEVGVLAARGVLVVAAPASRPGSPRAARAPPPSPRPSPSRR